MTEPFQLEIEGVPRAVSVVKLEGREAISQLSRLDVRIALPTVGTRELVGQMIGASAELRIAGTDAPARRIHGIISKARALLHHQQDSRSWYQLRLRPRLWLTKKGKDSRVFQDMSTRQIVEAVLSERSIGHQWRLERSYPERPYCVQYQESDYHFIRRLLAEDGIYYFFEDPDHLILADTMQGMRPIQAEHRLLYRPQDGLRENANELRSFVPTRAVVPTHATVRHHDHERPHVNFTSSAEHRDAARNPVEVYDFRYEIEEEEVAAHGATNLLEQVRRHDVTFEGVSSCRHLGAGRTMVVAEHVDADLDGEYCIAHLTYRGEQAVGGDRARTFDATCIALPAGAVPRPRRRKRKLQQVVETAVVTGPAGEEIHVDTHGRIKVQFHWDRRGDRTDRSSCWLRTVQPWAGAAWGSQFIPRVGMEVLVASVGGDADQPVVLGALYNGATPVPFPLPENKTQSGIRTASSPGGNGSNELRFEDAAGKEEIYLHAERDFEAQIDHDHRRIVAGKEQVVVGRDRHVAVDGNLVQTVGGHAVTSVERSRVVHVVGQQLIEIDGTVTDDGHDGAVPAVRVPSQPRALPVDHAYDALAATTARHDATLVFHSAHLPPDQTAIGDALETVIDLSTRELTALRTTGQQLAQQALMVRETPTLPEAPHTHLRALHLLRGRTEDYRRHVSSFLDTTEKRRDSLLQYRKSTADGLVDAADRTLASQRDEADYLLRRIDSAVAEAASAVHERGGVIRGGGGAPPTWKSVREMHFVGRPDKTKLFPSIHTVKGGSATVIKGGGEISSPDGFKLSANGCGMQLHNGNIMLDASYIGLQATEVEIVAANINIVGGTVDISGAPIKIAGGVVNVTGSPIKLN